MVKTHKYKGDKYNMKAVTEIYIVRSKKYWAPAEQTERLNAPTELLNKQINLVLDSSRQEEVGWNKQ
jgi:hypothetical protein